MATKRIKKMKADYTRTFIAEHEDDKKDLPVDFGDIVLVLDTKVEYIYNGNGEWVVQ